MYRLGASQRSKKNCSGSVSLPRNLIGSETSDAPHRLRQPTANLPLGDAPYRLDYPKDDAPVFLLMMWDAPN
jgi:hypothetical protein